MARRGPTAPAVDPVAERLSTRGRTSRPRPSASSFGSGTGRSWRPAARYVAWEPFATEIAGRRTGRLRRGDGPAPLAEDRRVLGEQRRPDRGDDC